VKLAATVLVVQSNVSSVVLAPTPLVQSPVLHPPRVKPVLLDTMVLSLGLCPRVAVALVLVVTSVQKEALFQQVSFVQLVLTANRGHLRVLCALLARMDQLLD